MRDIKFRWISKETWDFVFWLPVFSCSNILNIQIDDKTIFKSGWKEMKEIIPETLWQYTWLKDENWKEIYEGDILWSFWKWIRVLELEEWSFMIDVVTDSWDKWEYYYLREFNNYFHILGNIHENSELIK